MQLNLPITQLLQGCRNVLVAGMGGGFDVFCGLPIYLALQEAGFAVHLANYSFSDVATLRGGIRLGETLLGVVDDQPPNPSETADMAMIDPALGSMFAHWGAFLYFPELYLAQWFRRERGEAVTVWAMAKTGARPLLANYQTLIDHLAIDAVILVDGGVDSLARGDEHHMGTIVEDSISLAVINQFTDLKARMVACVGLGAEQEITYAHIFENIADLTRDGGFLGACALTPQMDVARDYAAAVNWVHSQPFQDPSVINASVLSALQGHYGNFHLTEKTRGSRLWISPLMTLYWFFDLAALARRHLLLEPLLDTDTPGEAVRSLLAARQSIRSRPNARVPL